MSRTIKSIVAVCSVLLASVAFAQTTSPSGYNITSSVTATSNGGTFSVTGAATPAAAGYPDAATFSLWVDSLSDILLFDVALTVTDGTWVNDNTSNLGPDTNPPSSALLPVFPGLNATSFITTPDMATAAAGTAVLDTVGTMITHFDSTDGGAQTGFNFGQIVLQPDANGVANATVVGQMQTAASPTPIFDDFTFTLGIAPAVVAVMGCTDMAATNFDPNATVDDGSCTYPPMPVLLGDVLGAEASVFFGANSGLADITGSDSANTYPNGVTVFVPGDSAAGAASANLQDLIVVDDGVSTGATDSGEPGWSAGDLDNKVPTLGDLVPLMALSGNPFDLENGSLIYGEATVVSSHQFDNGWVHVLDAVPVPEPGSLPLLMVAGLFGLVTVRRRRR